ncbi:MAG: hypothetical protein HYU37_06865 [Acidobacteria bacterium]|nr:hypothetical protein [Acidobacteriota bacterium]
MTLIRHGPATSPDQRKDLLDVFERVLREGGVFDIVETDDGEHGYSIWLTVTVAGVDVLKAVASLSWRRLLQSPD